MAEVGVVVRPLTKSIHVPFAKGGAYRDKQKQEVKQKQTKFFEARYDGGCGGNKVI
jgi:hypothetical protein